MEKWGTEYLCGYYLPSSVKKLESTDSENSDPQIDPLPNSDLENRNSLLLYLDLALGDDSDPRNQRYIQRQLKCQQIMDQAEFNNLAGRLDDLHTTVGQLENQVGEVHSGGKL